MQNLLGIDPLLEEGMGQLQRQQQQTDRRKKHFQDHFNYRPAEKSYHFSPNIILFRDYMFWNRAKSNLNKAAYGLQWIFVIHLPPEQPTLELACSWNYLFSWINSNKLAKYKPSLKIIPQPEIMAIMQESENIKLEDFVEWYRKGSMMINLIPTCVRVLWKTEIQQKLYPAKTLLPVLWFSSVLYKILFKTQKEP